MTNTTRIVIFIAWALLLPGIDGSVQHRSEPSPPLADSNNLNYPASEISLLRARDSLNKAAMRYHAWSLLATLTKDQDNPMWEKWSPKEDLRSSIAAAPPAACIAKPSSSTRTRMLQTADIPEQTLMQLFADHQKNPNIVTTQGFLLYFLKERQVASVLFSPAASTHVCTQTLYDKDTLNSLNLLFDTAGASVPMRERQIMPFPTDAIVVKLIWQIIHPKDKTYPGTNRIYAWNSILAADVQQRYNMNHNTSTNHDENPPPTWVSKPPGVPFDIAVDFRKNTPCKDQDYNGSIPINCLYTIPIGPILYNSINGQAGQTGQAGQAPPRLVELMGGEDDGKWVLVLMGVHITTKEIPDWTWQTFWFDNHASSDSPGPGDNGRQLLGPRWRHYAMSATLAVDTPTALDGGPNITFNPYLEARLTNGIVSNCVRCHQRAAHMDQMGPNCKLPEDQLINYALLDRMDVLNDQGRNSSCYFGKAVQTDFLWSLAQNSNQALKDFEKGVFAAMDAQLEPPPKAKSKTNTPR
jgi:hypothetical protein